MNRTSRQHSAHRCHHGASHRPARHGGHPTRAERNRPRRKSTHTIPPARRLPRYPLPG
jgi:hypothetical protein